MIHQLCCSKPLAAQIKQRAQNHPEARSLAIVMGRKYEAFTQRVEAMFAGVKLRELKTVTDAHALTVGVDLVSQGFLLSVALSLVVLEYWRNNKLKEEETQFKRNEKKLRQQIKEERMAAIEDRMHKLEFQLVTLEESITSLRRRNESTHAPLPPKSDIAKKRDSPPLAQSSAEQSVWSYIWGSPQRTEGSHKRVSDHADGTQATLESATKSAILPLDAVFRLVRPRLEAWMVSCVQRFGVHAVASSISGVNFRVLCRIPSTRMVAVQASSVRRPAAEGCVPSVDQLR
jgi:DNA-binding protein H-NS